MATGDLKGNLRKIEQGLRLINYSRDVDYTGLANGDPSVFLPIISYCFTSFSPSVTELVVESRVELTAKNDSRFVDAIYKLLRDKFQYKPILSKQQFLQYGFAERKIQIVCDIINYIYKKHKEFSNMNKVKSQTEKRIHSIKSLPQAKFPNQLDTAIISAMDFQQIALNKEKDSQLRLGYSFEKGHRSAPEGKQKEEEEVVALIPCFSCQSLTEKPQEEHCENVISIHIPEDLVSDALREENDYIDNAEVPISSTDVFDNVPEQVLKEKNEIEELKSQLAELQEKFNTLNYVEEKLQTLEKKLQGKIIIDENEWNNLLSRVLLLETQLLLHSKTVDLSTEFNNVNEENASKKNITPVSSDKEKIELPESLHQSSGYNSLLSADSSPKAMVINNYGVSGISNETTMQRMERINKMIEETSELLKTSHNTS